MKLSELLENILDMDRCIKAHLNTLFHSKTGNLIRGEEYSNRLMKMLLQGSMKLSVRQVRWLTKMAKNSSKWSLDRKSHYNSKRLSRWFYGRK